MEVACLGMVEARVWSKHACKLCLSCLFARTHGHNAAAHMPCANSLAYGGGMHVACIGMAEVRVCFRHACELCMSCLLKGVAVSVMTSSALTAALRSV